MGKLEVREKHTHKFFRETRIQSGIAEPGVFYCHSAGKANRAVYHNRPPVIPSVDSSPFAELRRAKFFYPAAGAFEFGEFPKRHFLRTEVIQQHSHRDIPPRRSDECVK